MATSTIKQVDVRPYYIETSGGTVSVPTVDNTLAISGAAADAKKTGDEIASLNTAVANFQNKVNFNTSLTWERKVGGQSTGLVFNPSSSTTRILSSLITVDDLRFTKMHITPTSGFKYIIYTLSDETHLSKDISLMPWQTEETDYTFTTPYVHLLIAKADDSTITLTDRDKVDFTLISSAEAIDEAFVGAHFETISGSADGIMSDTFITDSEPYLFRKSKTISNAVYEDIVGGSIVWNQLTYVTAGTSTANGLTITKNSNGTVLISGTSTAHTGIAIKSTNTLAGHVYLCLGCPANNGTVQYFVGYAGLSIDTGNGGLRKETTSGATNIRIDVESNVTLNNLVFTPQMFDLTQMFGTEIADYVYNLEQSTTGAGVAWFKHYFPNDYYEYNAGTLMSVNVKEKDVCGKNLIDQSTLIRGSISGSGEDTISGSRARSQLIHAYPNIQYSASTYDSTGKYIIYESHYYNSQKVWLGYTGHSTVNATFTTPENCRYIKILIRKADNSNFYIEELSKVQLEYGSTNTPYEPYKGASYVLDASKQLRGIPKLVNGWLGYDGDLYIHDGKVIRKYGIADLGTRTIGYNSDSGYFYTSGVSNKKKGEFNLICDIYPTVSISTTATDMPDRQIRGTYDNYNIFWKDSRYTTAESMKDALIGHYIIYELASPTIEDAEPFVSPMCVYDGAEEFVDYGAVSGTRDVAIPVGHNSRYTTDLKGKIEHIDTAVVGTAFNIASSATIAESVPYNYRKTGGDEIVGGNVYEQIVGGSIAWNQLIEYTSVTYGVAGITYTGNGQGKIHLEGTSTGTSHLNFNPVRSIPSGHKVYFRGCPSTGTENTFYGRDGYVASSVYYDIGNGTIESVGNDFTYQIVVTSGTTVNVDFYPQVFDLTQMFGSTLADYIYSLETANAGDGVAFFRKMFPNDYYTYSAGSLQSVSTVGKECVGFNLHQEKWRQGDYNNATQARRVSDIESTRIRVRGGVQYCCNYSLNRGNYGYTLVLLEEPNSSSYIWWNGGFLYTSYILTPPKDCYLAVIWRKGDDTNLTPQEIESDVNFSISIHSDRDGTYEPYHKVTYPLDPIPLRGVPQLVSNKVKYDGDVYNSDGIVVRRYGIVDLGTLTWLKINDYNGASVYYTNDLTNVISKPSSNTAEVFASEVRIVCSKYVAINANSQYSSYTVDQNISINGSGQVLIRDFNYSTADSFKNSLNGVYFIYKLATPVVESASPYEPLQYCNGYGTEEFIDYGVETGIRDVVVPVGHNSRYGKDLKGKLEELSGIPTPPSANGTYTLKATRSNSGVTYSWV